MPSGTVMWFNTEKGFGFIKADNDGPNVFFHYSDMAIMGFREPQEGQRVEYDSEQGSNGPVAKQVKLV